MDIGAVHILDNTYSKVCVPGERNTAVTKSISEQWRRGLRKSETPRNVVLSRLENLVFRVDVDSLQAYFDFDPKRRNDLQKLDKLLRESAPGLKRYFHRGTPPGEPGMRFKMIGYGRFHYRTRSGKTVEWPVVGVALQKNYISVYLSVAKDGVPLLQSYSGKLGEIRSGRNNFSFDKYEDLVTPVMSSLFAEAQKIFASSDDRIVTESLLAPRRPVRKITIR